MRSSPRVPGEVIYRQEGMTRLPSQRALSFRASCEELLASTTTDSYRPSSSRHGSPVAGYAYYGVPTRRSRPWFRKCIVSGLRHKNQSECSKCGRRFSSGKQLRAHMKDMHKSPTCSECGASFTSATRLKQHLAAHDVRVRQAVGRSKRRSRRRKRVSRDAPVKLDSDQLRATGTTEWLRDD